MRTTIDIDAPVLAQLKAIQKEDGRPLGRLVSDLLVIALHERTNPASARTEPLHWIAKPMGARLDLSDREAVYDLMGEDIAP